MPDIMTTSRFTLRARRYDPKLLSEQLAFDNPLAQEVAQAIFDADVKIMAITCRKGLHCSRQAPPYRNEDHYLLLHLQGYLEFEFGGQSHVVRPGQLAYCPPGELLETRGKPNGIARFLYFVIEDNEYWGPLKAAGHFIEDYDSADLLYLLARRLLDAHRARDVQSLNTARSEARMLLILLRRLRFREGQPDRETLALRALAEQVSANPGAEWTQDAMARSLAVSPRSLLRLFQKEYDLSPGEWVIQRRMEYAMDLLTQSETPIKEIAYSCGYESIYSFMRLFRKRIGVPPGQYRDRYRPMQGG